MHNFISGKFLWNCVILFAYIWLKQYKSHKNQAENTDINIMRMNKITLNTKNSNKRNKISLLDLQHKTGIEKWFSKTNAKYQVPWMFDKRSDIHVYAICYIHSQNKIESKKGQTTRTFSCIANSTPSIRHEVKSWYTSIFKEGETFKFILEYDCIH